MKILRTYDLTFDERDPLWPDLVNLLQAGFWIEALGVRSVRAFMRETLGFDDDYIEGSIGTVFVDSQPVDDLDAALVGPGSRLALSAAMPGLVGAVMRIKSPYASFRSAISYGAAVSADGEGAVAGVTAKGGLAAGKSAGGLVFVKLFNAVMAERGPSLLERGLLVDASELAPLAARLGSGLGAAQADAGLVAAERLGGASSESRAGLSGDPVCCPIHSAYDGTDGKPDPQGRERIGPTHSVSDSTLVFLRVQAAAKPKESAGSGGEAQR